MLVSSFPTSPEKFSKFDAGNVILFLGRNIKDITLASYFIKVTVRPIFTPL